ncbi:MAG: Hint domain-containing protein [Arenicella sp.]|nr:Hint domain-containing protein [Arenicella sp.]
MFTTLVQQPVVPGISNVSVTNINEVGATLDFTVTSDGLTSVTETGIRLSTSEGGPIFAIYPSTAGAGAKSVVINDLPAITGETNYYVKAFATNSVGTALSDEASFATRGICLIEGTLCRLSDGSEIRIEDVSYNDELLVWNFDEAKFGSAKPIWIKVVQTVDRYGQVSFSDGSTLGAFKKHRIFNKQAGMFTYLMDDDTPIGTITINAVGKEVSVVSKKWVEEKVNIYNVVTDTHLNMFTNGLLTSCRLNNLYPIADMRFVKDDRVAKQIIEFTGVSEKVFNGLRLAEQPISVEALQEYVDRMYLLEVSKFSQPATFKQVDKLSKTTA